MLVPILLLAALAASAEVRITGGVVDDQVIQRDPASNRADLVLSGSSDSPAVEARILRKHDVVEGFDWAPVAKTQAGKWTATLHNVPSGGPYRIEVRSGQSTCAVQNVLVGDLWLLAGQSNMQGVGDLIDVEPPHEMVHNFDMADRWMVAEEPLHTLGTAADRVHWPLDQNKQPAKLEGERLRLFLMNRKKGAGLGLPFAVEMVRRTGVPVGLLSCAHGGTSMSQWDPALLDKAGDSLYGSMIRRVRAAGGKVRGVLWYQGESDASDSAAPLFQKRFEDFVGAVRKDTGIQSLPFYYVQIGRHVSSADGAVWNLVQEAQRKAESTIPNSGMAATIDFDLDDGIHAGTKDLKRLGKRMANLALNSNMRGPRPMSATFSNGVLRVAFSGVTGRLQAPGRVAGFSIRDGNGAEEHVIYKMNIDPADGSVVRLYVGGKIADGSKLWYGWGRNPYCNLADSADMGVPVFGPMNIE
jgi:sialate O-acetylesterase